MIQYIPHSLPDPSNVVSDGLVALRSLVRERPYVDRVPRLPLCRPHQSKSDVQCVEMPRKSARCFASEF